MSRADVDVRLGKLQGWERDGCEIEKEFRFDGFDASMAFVNRVAGLAREADHHPDISIKYNRVKLTLSTHSEGGVTEKDFALAAKIEGVAQI
jgi:4a-hydroxytetrahydrobiopterin dehydratase